MNKVFIGLMTGVCVVLGGTIVFLHTSADRTAPVITFQENSMTYAEGDSYDTLLEDVTAQDDRDGDVSDTLVVENVYPEGDTATVIYVARDTSNNISKAKRQVTYQANEKPISIDLPEEQDMEGQESVSQKEEDAPMAVQTEPEDSEEQQMILPDDEKPVIRLTTDQVTIHAGDSINRVTFVDSITDDKDDNDQLWRCIQITGDEFDSNVPGVYEQIYYVVDSDGNKSNEETLTITVE